MKRLSALTFGLLVSLGLALSANAAPQFGIGRDRGERDRVCVYKDIHYQGWEQCYNAGDEVNTLGGRNNAVSSIRIYGRASVTVYSETNFRGQAAEFSSNVPDLGLRSLAGGKTWSDHIQSLRVGGSQGGGGYYPGRDYPGNNPGNGRNYPDQYPNNSSNPRNMTGVCVYDQKDFRGREQCFDPGSQISDLARSGNWSDRIQSIRVFGRVAVTLYRDVGFRGGNVTIDRDVPDLSQVSGNGFRDWDKQASSMTIGTDRGRGRGRDRERYWR
jgi:hypothetical protein